MPRFDKTGPRGKGAKTGRGLGDCDENKSPRNEPDKNTEGWMDLFLKILRALKR